MKDLLEEINIKVQELRKQKEIEEDLKLENMISKFKLQYPEADLNNVLSMGMELTMMWGDTPNQETIELLFKASHDENIKKKFQQELKKILR